MAEDKTAYDKSVFINCPFDTEYIPILHAITFSILFSGYIPRSAAETKDSGTERLVRVVKIISECRYGIHDISRIEHDRLISPDGEELARFNMPFECGMFFGALHYGSRKDRSKSLLILDSEKHRVQRILSDIGGKDPSCHNSTPTAAIACVRNFFNNKPGSKNLPGEEYFQKVYVEFIAELPNLLAQFKLNGKEIVRMSYWTDFVTIVDEYLKKKSPFPGVSG